MRYIADDQLALSIAQEKIPQELNIELLGRFARKAGVPSKLVFDTASETADMMMRLWRAIQK